MDMQSERRKARIETDNDVRLIKLGAVLAFRKAYIKLFECSKLYIKSEQGDAELPNASVVTKHRSYPLLMSTLSTELVGTKDENKALEFLGLLEYGDNQD